MKSQDIRSQFLAFFETKKHQVLASAPMVVKDDPSLLFVNSGMAPFKAYFLEDETPPKNRITDTQKCLRVSGKHNDLEEVGYDTYHHTLFEMLGNWSFGDYFKKEAIEWAWELLTEVYKIDKEILYVTVFEGSKDDNTVMDSEAFDYWKTLIPEDRILMGNKDDNFWEMGEQGPCGPCSEIHVDIRSNEEKAKISGHELINKDHPQVVEIWNLVFMEFNRKANGSLVPLPNKHIDTGMGFERLCMVLQNVTSNYDTDVFTPIIREIETISGLDYGKHTKQDIAIRVIADHVRAVAFSIADGQLPSNTGAGYVIRRILRRAVRYGFTFLELKDPFMYRLVSVLTKQMGAVFPELLAQKQLIQNVIKEEETSFLRTLDQGLVLLDRIIETTKGSHVSGDKAFELYDTYGFPVDLTADVARESNIMLDMEGFEAAMQVQREQARAAGNFSAVDKLELDGVEITDFRGYEVLEATGDVAAIYVDGEPRDALKAGESATLVLTRSPFYGESGGQVGDSGTLFADGVEFRVDDTQKQNDVMLHNGELVIGSLKLGASLGAQVAANARKAITLNHSATHLMHSALRNTLGEHVTQKGSLVDAARLRFDFSHSAPMTADEIATIEAAVNVEILANTSVAKEVMALEAAQQRGAMALFGEKYGDEVRVVSMGGKFSVEFCGGTHVERTGDIGLFKIVGESGISSGVRRIEAVTGQGALALVAREEQTLKQLCELVKANQEDLLDRVKQINASNKALEKELDQLKAKIASSAGSDLASSAKDVAGIKLLACAVDDFDPKALRETVDQLKNKLGSAVVLLISTAGGKVSIVAGVSKDLTDRVKAGELANMVATQVGGKGGGRPDMAMAGGSDVAAVPAAVASVEEWVASKL